MKAFEKALALNLIPWLSGCRFVRRNARLGDSLIDYFLECTDGNLVINLDYSQIEMAGAVRHSPCGLQLNKVVENTVDLTQQDDRWSNYLSKI